MRDIAQNGSPSISHVEAGGDNVLLVERKRMWLVTPPTGTPTRRRSLVLSAHGVSLIDIKISKRLLDPSGCLPCSSLLWAIWVAQRETCNVAWFVEHNHGSWSRDVMNNNYALPNKVFNRARPLMGTGVQTTLPDRPTERWLVPSSICRERDNIEDDGPQRRTFPGTP